MGRRRAPAPSVIKDTGLRPRSRWRGRDRLRPPPKSPVLMTPDVRFGKPAVSGISTEVIWEHDQAGEDVEEIAEAFGLTVVEVRWALAYETSAGAA